ncbi:MAG: hypothetical protein R3A52_15990 [Polyangiales bacterium]
MTAFSVGMRVDLAEPAAGVDRALDGAHLLTRVVHSGVPSRSRTPRAMA